MEFIFKSTKSLSIGEINEIYETGRTAFPEITSFSTDEKHHAYLHPIKLHPLKQITLAINSARITGYLPAEDSSIPELAGIFQTGQEIGKLGLLQARVGFEEKSSKQTKRGYDTVSAQMILGKMYFSYAANGSKVTKDVSYRKSFLADVIHVLGLPLTIQEVKDGFTLTHQEGKALVLLRAGFAGQNPEHFRCEMEKSGSELVEMIRTFLNHFASKKRFEVCWSVAYPGIAEPAIGKKLYELTSLAGFPAVDYFLDLEFSLQDISAIDLLRELCGQSDDGVYVRLFSFELDDEIYGDLKSFTTQAGHFLKVSMNSEDRIAEVEAKLGVNFEKSED